MYRSNATYRTACSNRLPCLACISAIQSDRESCWPFPRSTAADSPEVDDFWENGRPHYVLFALLDLAIIQDKEKNDYRDRLRSYEGSEKLSQGDNEKRTGLLTSIFHESKTVTRSQRRDPEKNAGAPVPTTSFHEAKNKSQNLLKLKSSDTPIWKFRQTRDVPVQIEEVPGKSRRVIGNYHDNGAETIAWPQS